MGMIRPQHFLPGFPAARRTWQENGRHGVESFSAPGVDYFIVPEGVYTVWVTGTGAGGGGGSDDATGSGSAGGTTSFGNLITLPGGGGGQGVTTSLGQGGVSGGSYGDSGAPGELHGSNYLAGYGGASIFGPGGSRREVPGTTILAGVASPSPGAGGGGGRENGSATGGGGAGQGCYREPVQVVPGQRITVTIGSRGTGGPSNNYVGGAGGHGLLIVEW